MTKREKAHKEHMERVRAIHRRSYAERLLSRIAYYEAVEEPDEGEREHLKTLKELLADVRAEMIEHGQIEA